jgi:hypothetical protein
MQMLHSGLSMNNQHACIFEVTHSLRLKEKMKHLNSKTFKGRAVNLIKQKFKHPGKIKTSEEHFIIFILVIMHI